MIDEDDLLPISGLQHLAYCPRQFALIHIEQTWEENLYTAEGRLLHRKVDQLGHESRGSVQIARGLRLRSLTHGLTGIADVVEFHHDQSGIELRGKKGRWRPAPVEYKRGRPKKGAMDEIQLCAQALCLEEMLDTVVAAGALFYGKTRRRKDIDFTAGLRQQTLSLAMEMRRIWNSGRTPAAEYGPKCDQCSLRSRCLPKGSGRDRSHSYIETIFTEDE